MVFLIKRAVIISIVLCALLVGVTITFGKNPSAPVASSIGSDIFNHEWFQLYDIERLMRVRIPFPLEKPDVVNLSWQDGKLAYFSMSEILTTQPAITSQHTYYRFDLATLTLTQFYQTTADDAVRLMESGFIDTSPDKRYLVLWSQDYHLIDTQTQTLFPLSDLIPTFSGSSAWRFPSLVWSPLSDYLAVGYGATLYLVALPTFEVREIQLAESGDFYLIWSDDGAQILAAPSGEWVSPPPTINAVTGETQPYFLVWPDDGSQILAAPTSEPLPPPIVHVATGSVELYNPDVDVDWNNWACERGWLIRRYLKAPDDLSFVLAVDDPKSGTTRILNDYPALRNTLLEYAISADCEHLIVFGMPAAGVGYGVSYDRPIYVVKPATDTVVLIDKKAALIDWIEAEAAAVYSKPLRGQRYEVFKRTLEPDAQPERLGEYDAYNGSTAVWSADYRYVLQVESAAPNARAPLTVTDLRSGQAYPLTEEWEYGAQLIPWQ